MALAFTFSGDILDVDVLGVVVMIAGALALALGALRVLRSRGPRPPTDHEALPPEEPLVTAARAACPKNS